MTEVSQALFLKMLEILLPINRNQNDKKILWAGPSGVPSLSFLWKEAGREPYLRNDGLHFLVGPQGFEPRTNGL